MLVWALTLDDAVERPFSEVERYSASLGDFVARDPGVFERFVYLGWLTPLAAVAGLVVLVFEPAPPRARLAAVLGLGARVPCLLALGANLPGYGRSGGTTPLHSTRVPGAPAPDRLPLPRRARRVRDRLSVVTTQSSLWRVADGRALLVAADLWVPLYDPLNADEGNAVYAASTARRPGGCSRCRALPPDAYAGSVYLYYAMQAPRERPLGYSTSAPPEAFATARALARNPSDRALLRRLGVRYVVDHRDGRPTGFVTIP